MRRPRLPRLRTAVWAFALLLGVSHLVRALRSPTSPPPEGGPIRVVSVPTQDGRPVREASAGPDAPAADDRVAVVLERDGPPPGETPGKLPVVLLHGSPGGRRNLERLGGLLAEERTALRPDLPGFGRSSRDVPDYSIYAHARYVREVCDALGIERFHVVGFSMGGGVAIALGDLCPDRVASITLLASIGVQELELLGDYHLNHLVHGLQLACLVAMRELVPHFGVLDGSMFSVEYARNFYDTDQRPLRGMLEAWDGPLAILHSPTDVLVPIAAAREHERIVPQAELELFGGGHFIPFRRAECEAAGAWLDDFLDRVEAGAATTRATATAERLARAHEPFDPAGVPPASGFGLLSFCVLIALATLVSEDLTCITVGAMVGQGRISFLAGTAACIVGIYVGDLLLFLAGRWVGRGMVQRAPLSWFLSEERLARSSVWLERRGPFVIFLSRFLPGARLPTYFASGVLRTSFWRFSFWFAVAALLWTPILVWLSGKIGGALTERMGENLGLGLLATLAVVFVILKVVRPLLSRRGRRGMLGRWQRIRHHEFWPVWVFYVPVVGYCAWRALVERRLLAFTAANPGIPHSGVIGESKSEILELVRRSAPDALPRSATLPESTSPAERTARARAFQRENGLDFPIVVKPDVGERGSGVRIVRDDEALARTFEEEGSDAAVGRWMVQEFCGGVEYGLFYAREPGAPRGELFSITRKDLPTVVGDGEHDLEALIHRDRRTRAQAPFLLEKNRDRLAWVPDDGERVRLGDIGSHCRGTRFTDGRDVHTDALLARLDGIARGIEGFHFGRFDVKSESAEALRRGEFRIIELNGVTSEAGDAYDPAKSLFQAWGTIFGQWRRAYRIGALNARRGARVTGLFELLGLLLSRGRSPAPGPELPRPRPEASGRG